MPVTPAERERYAALMEEAVRQASTLGTAAAPEAGRLFRHGLDNIASHLRRYPPERWTPTMLRRIRREIYALADEMGVQLQTHAIRSLENAARVGSAAVVGPLVESGVLSAGVASRFPVIDSVLVNVASAMTADLIREVRDDVKHAIARDVSAAIISGEGQFDTIKRIEDRLRRSKASKLTFDSLEARAEAQVRTETNRTLSLAQQARGQQLVQMFPALKKRWGARGDGRTRPAHAAEAGETPIPFADPFVFTGPHTGRPVKLWFPRDPGAEGDEEDIAALTILCRCWLVYVIPRNARRPDDVPPPATAALEADVERLHRRLAA